MIDLPLNALDMFHVSIDGWGASVNANFGNIPRKTIQINTHLYNIGTYEYKLLRLIQM